MDDRFASELTALIKDAEKLPLVPREAAGDYEKRRDLLLKAVNEEMGSRPDIGFLIGQNPLEMMVDNHRNHFQFMLNIFKLNHFELLARTLPWVYRSYHAHGFSFDYFPQVLKTWMKAVDRFLPQASAKAVNRIYQWMMDRHRQVIALSENPALLPPRPEPSWEKEKEAFFAALLRGNHQECLGLAEKRVSSAQELSDFYLQVIQPSLYEIGLLWEQGEISVAQEHLASAIVTRVMAALSPRFIPLESTKGKAVVTSASNEYHAIGGWMVADHMEIDGWEVRYLGPNTPVKDLVQLIKDFRPHLLSLSVTMPFNLDRAEEIIRVVKTEPEFGGVRIMVGGLVFQNAPNLWERIGADEYAPNAREAAALAGRWWNSLGR